MKKVLKNVVIIVYVIIAILVTICLLSYNKFKTTQFGDTTLVVIDNSELEPTYKKGSIAFVKNSDVEIGDEIFYYNSFGNQINISVAKVTNKEVLSETQGAYTMESGKVIATDHIIGKTSNVTTVSGIGYVLGALESKWGYLFLIVLPTLLAFLYEIYEIVIQIREGKNSKE